MLKFRVWDAEEKEMTYPEGDCFYINHTGEVIIFHKEDPEITEVCGTGHLFSGVKDEAEQDVYVHDYVITAYGFGKVIFHAGSFYISWLDDREANAELLGFDRKWKKVPFLKIGNQFENPEYEDDKGWIRGMIKPGFEFFYTDGFQAKDHLLMKVISVNPVTDLLHVSVEKVGTKSHWEEDGWNLQHTVWAFERGEYHPYLLHKEKL